MTEDNMTENNKKPVRQEALEEAARLISQDRAADYGPVDQNFTRIAAGWAVIFGVPIDTWQVALACDWIKTARIIANPFSQATKDSWVDKIGYSALGAEESERLKVVMAELVAMREKK